MAKKYKLLPKVIFIFVAALFAGLVFNSSFVRAEDIPYTIEGWKNTETIDSKLHEECPPQYVGKRCTDVDNDKIYAFCSPFETGRECRYPKCGAIGSGTLVRTCPQGYECQMFKSSNSGLEYKGCAPLTPGATPLDTLLVDLSARKPILEINIPGLKFGDVVSSTDETGTYFYISWIPELISAVYKFGIAIVSIVAVVVIIIQGMRVVASGGGEAKASAYKKILQSAIGLVIAWGSFAILYNINPKLVEFNALKVKVIEKKILETFDKPPVYDEGSGVDKSSEYTGKAIPPSELDPLFAAYAACYGYDPTILKAIAKVESGLKPYANPGEKYQGLFQMTQSYCENGLKHGNYPSSLKLDCNNRIEPETNTAAAAATIYQNLKTKILSKCPNASVQDVISLAYVAHNNGPAVMDFAISDKVCTSASIRANVRKFYEKSGKPLLQRKESCDAANKGALTRYATKYGHVLDGNTIAKGCVTADWGEGKYDVGVRAAKIASPGNSPIFPSGGKKDSICPRLTGKRVLP